MNSLKKRILSAVAALSVAAAGVGTFPHIDIPVYATEPEISEGEYSGELISASLEDDGITGEDMINNYVEKQFNDALNAGKVRLFRGTTSARANLDGVNAYVYDTIKPMIEEVAAGTRTSTVFTVSLSDMCTACGMSAPENLLWSSYNVETVMQGNTLTTQAREAISQAGESYRCDFGEVVRALIVDCPYELYWFDKTAIYSCSNFAGSCSYNSTYFTLSGDFTLCMRVSQDYQPTGYDDSNPTVDPDKTAKVDASVAKVRTAIANAQTIVNKHAGETTLEKLISYKNEICDFTSYNNTAAGGGVSYGDPWQLVYVFDGDDSTKVVCEGYSKAFKYLCDLSNFTNVSCILVTGTMTGGTGAGSHMWNILRMDDNKSYLVDVTNCDGNSVGAPGNLFMKVPSSGTYAGNNYKYSLSPNVTYTYDQDTIDIWGEDILTLSTTEYSGSSVSVNTVSGVSISLGGEIGLNFYLSVPDESVTYNITGPKGTETGTVSSLSMGTGDYASCHVLTYRVNASQMGENVTLTLKDGTTTLPLYNGNSEEYTGDECICSVNTYIASAKGQAGNTEALNTLLGAMYTYGAYAADYFNVAALPGSGLDTLPSIDASSTNTYQLDYSSVPEGIKIEGMTLVLREKTSARLYFSTANVGAHTFTVGGKSVTPVAKNNMYYIEYSNIPAHLLGESHVATIDGVSFTFSGLTYVNRTLVNHKTEDKSTRLVKALYAFSQAAAAYH